MADEHEGFFFLRNYMLFLDTGQLHVHPQIAREECVTMKSDYCYIGEMIKPRDNQHNYFMSFPSQHNFD